MVFALLLFTFEIFHNKSPFFFSLPVRHIILRFLIQFFKNRNEKIIGTVCI